MERKRVALIGECMVEMSGTLLGEMRQGFGGDTLNTAVYLKRLLHEQVDVSFITAMGNDSLSSAIISEWQKEGIDTGLVLKDKERLPGLYMVETAPNGERTFHYWRDRSAAKFLVQHKKFSAVTQVLDSFDQIVVSGISLAILSPRDRETLIAVLSIAKQKGTKIVFDGNYRPSLWSSVGVAKSCYERLYTLADYALLTLDDELALWKDENEQAALTRLKQYDLCELVLKLGAEGCTVRTQGAVHRVPAICVQNVVDTTAAGDSFNAGYLAARLIDRLPLEACEVGNSVASQVIQHRGAIVRNSELTISL